MTLAIFANETPTVIAAAALLLTAALFFIGGDWRARLALVVGTLLAAFAADQTGLASPVATGGVFAAALLLFSAVARLAAPPAHRGVAASSLAIACAAALCAPIAPLLPGVVVATAALSPSRASLRHAAGLLATVWTPTLLTLLAMKYVSWLTGLGFPDAEAWGAPWNALSDDRANAAIETLKRAANAGDAAPDVQVSTLLQAGLLQPVIGLFLLAFAVLGGVAGGISGGTGQRRAAGGVFLAVVLTYVGLFLAGGSVAIMVLFGTAGALALASYGRRPLLGIAAVTAIAYAAWCLAQTAPI